MNYPQLPEERQALYAQEKIEYEGELAKTPLGQLKLKFNNSSEAEKIAIQKEMEELPLMELKNELTLVEEKMLATQDKVALRGLETQKENIEASLIKIPDYYYQEKISELNNAHGAEALRNSIAGRLGLAVEGISKYAGFDWRTNLSLMAGIAAKEVIVSTLGTAYSLGDIDPEGDSTIASRIAADPHWNVANATALLLFSLLYSPCFVTVVMIRQETGSTRWAIFSIVFNLVLAFAVAVTAYQLLLPMV